MIIYGSRATELKSRQLTNETCSGCDNQGSIVMGLFSKYAHIFWIPIFPIGKSGVSQCQHCKQVLESKNMTGSLKQEYDILKSAHRAPAWQFVGLALIAAFAVFIYTSGKQDTKNEIAYIDSPQMGDVYEFKTESNNYSTLKVIEVMGDSIYIKQNQYETTKTSGIYKIDKEENYDEVEYGISIQELKELYDDGTIYDVNRH